MIRLKDALDMLMPWMATSRSDQSEGGDPLAEWVAHSRPSTTSKTRYAKWKVADSNREVADELRDEWSERKVANQTRRETFHDGAHLKYEETKEQRAAALARVQRVRQAKADLGSRTKDEVSAAVKAAHEQQDSWRKHGVETQQKLGRDLTASLRRQRERHAEECRQGAEECRNAEMARDQQMRQAQEEDLERRRQRVARIRNETRPEVAQTSRYIFFKQRKETADDVRESVLTWKVEKDLDHDENLEHARANRAYALEVQQRSVEGMRSLQKRRSDEASAMRDSINRALEERIAHEAELSRAAKESHASALANSFVEPYAAQIQIPHPVSHT